GVVIGMPRFVFPQIIPEFLVFRQSLANSCIISRITSPKTNNSVIPPKTIGMINNGNGSMCEENVTRLNVSIPVKQKPISQPEIIKIKFPVIQDFQEY
ncbi:hypothetical protein, partial [Lactiplantibacillus plantarum]|uniref:hypothetical protein n=1 Tax=Lactiplantibacillus plantarum TaxID=1590 RepID=UPI0025B4C4BF